MSLESIVTFDGREELWMIQVLRDQADDRLRCAGSQTKEVKKRLHHGFI